MNNICRIRRASRRLRWVLMLVWIAVPLVNALVWIFINQLPEAIRRDTLSYIIWPLPPLTRLLGFAICLLPVGVVMYGAHILIRLFHLYEHGQIFKPVNVQCYRRLSLTLIAWFIVSILTDPLMSVTLTTHHPPGQRMLALGLESLDITALLVGSILAVIAWIMEEGRKLQEEQDLTV